MVLKQKPIQTCVCGQAIEFPQGEIRAKCPCGSVWECGEEGYWYAEIHDSISVNPKSKPQPNRYARYMARRNKSKRKAGRR